MRTGFKNADTSTYKWTLGSGQVFLDLLNVLIFSGLDFLLDIFSLTKRGIEDVQMTPVQSQPPLTNRSSLHCRVLLN